MLAVLEQNPGTRWQDLLEEIPIVKDAPDTAKAKWDRTGTMNSQPSASALEGAYDKLHPKIQRWISDQQWMNSERSRRGQSTLS